MSIQRACFLGLITTLLTVTLLFQSIEKGSSPYVTSTIYRHGARRGTYSVENTPTPCVLVESKGPGGIRAIACWSPTTIDR